MLNDLYNIQIHDYTPMDELGWCYVDYVHLLHRVVAKTF